MAGDFKTSKSVIDTATIQVAEVISSIRQPFEKQGIVGRIKEKANEFWSQTRTSMDIRHRYEDPKQTAQLWAEHIIKIIVIFLMQTATIPLLLVWILYLSARVLISNPGSSCQDARNS